MVKFTAVGTNKQKGNSLEQFFGKILSVLGYINLKQDVHKTGEEVDIQGTNRLITHSIKCECKAHKDPISSPPLAKFFGNLQKELSRNPKTTGLFISTSGFTGTASEWYEELTDEQKESFKLIDKNELFSELKSAKLICSEEELKLSISMKTQIPYKDSTIILSERGIFWEVTLEDEKSGDLYYILLDSQGKEINRSDSDYLLTMDDFTSKNFVSLEIKEELLTKLLNVDTISVNNLISELDEPPQEINSAVANSIAENIVDNNSGEISLRNEIDSFLNITKYFDDKEQIITLMESKYYENNLKSVIRYIESKFILKFTDENKKTVFKILAVSPRALLHCLFGSSDSCRNRSEDLDKLNFEPNEMQELLNKARTDFIKELTFDLMVDMGSYDNSKLLQKNEIVLFKLNAEVVLAKTNELFVKSKLEHFMALVETEGPIKEGQYITYTGPRPHFITAGAFIAMEEYELALGEYVDIIKHWKNDEVAVIAAIYRISLFSSGKV